MSGSKPRKLSPSAVKVLRNLSRGREPSEGFFGMSEMGGLASIVMMLRRRGLITDNEVSRRFEITSDGRKELKNAS